MSDQLRVMGWVLVTVQRWALQWGDLRVVMLEHYWALKKMVQLKVLSSMGLMKAVNLMELMKALRRVMMSEEKMWAANLMELMMMVLKYWVEMTLVEKM